MSKQHWMIRQGDVVVTSHVYDKNDKLVPVQPSGPTADAVQRDPEIGVVLQSGTLTGHHHVMPGGAVVLVREPDGSRKIEVASAEPLIHDEHHTIEIQPGVLTVGIQVEYVPGAVPRQVED